MSNIYHTNFKSSTPSPSTFNLKDLQITQEELQFNRTDPDFEIKFDFLLKIDLLIREFRNIEEDKT